MQAIVAGAGACTTMLVACPLLLPPPYTPPTLMATRSPVRQPVSAAPWALSRPRCTCPMLPQAMGSSSTHSNSSEGGNSNDLRSAAHVYLQQ